MNSFREHLMTKVWPYAKPYLIRTVKAMVADIDDKPRGKGR